MRKIVATKPPKFKSHDSFKVSHLLIDRVLVTSLFILFFYFYYYYHYHYGEVYNSSDVFTCKI